MIDSNSYSLDAKYNTTLQPLIERYVNVHRQKAFIEKNFFKNMPSLEMAIEYAAFAKDHRNPPKRYSHQRRIRLTPMRDVHWFLSNALIKLRSMQSFDDLHNFLLANFSQIKGVGALYVYDTALRIGFHLKLEPLDVYLHAGTKDGAQALNIKQTKKASIEKFPEELRSLAPHEIENFLCIFKPNRKSQSSC